MTEPKPRAIRSRPDKSRGGTSGSSALFQLRVGDVIARLLPSGSRGTRADPARPWADDRHAWASCPDWPPDLFAATVVQAYQPFAAQRRITAPLVLSLTLGWERGYSFDGRDDRGSSLRVALGGAHGVRDPTPEAWLDA